ncbi:Uncharacterized protein FWK35_00014208 [Aphis craccivora]|uniref:FLYWCH-type domain-containing protein n=1 Tax=Aphis craccivora TaxID=307492 RepID=A0A6G0YEJ0_APHCR|nr:Uncharacterized protein FWK35_00014208 [Aphis craccivora]
MAAVSKNHRQDRRNENKIICRCNENQNCPGWVHSLDNDILKYVDHSHLSNVAKIQARKTVEEIKTLAKENSLTTRAIIGEGSSQLSAAVSAQLPNSRALKSTIQRVRQIKQIAPENPNSLNFEIPDTFKKTLCGEQFLFLDSASLEHFDDRILIFSTWKDLEYWNALLCIIIVDSLEHCSNVPILPILYAGHNLMFII